ncbi:MAG: hypothetical protein A2941_00670 [Candidatus Yanofskybacteria bacterium RIFCSPLOWO2_01_FULL_49_17]|uniref:Glycosyltransferase subfamily 4-like N-terminal domain-containing protein n=1 Tax=Candidatus Yanofskybacteria bacterium RIFCSPLOWO2_01_FULL_49_17 TaxID=1802700 RepID=A0A1F8GT80_9BACT|nr:MAG: hypothetical protein A2941_00670 [Candidatus Yanofskybacteria bacterium RIFCSPLOWO2_01_FULL_49_17]
MAEKINLSQSPKNTPKKRAKKRVLFIITQSEFGGAQRFIYEVLRQLVRGHYQLMLAVGRDGDGSLIRLTSALGVDTVTLTCLRRNIRPVQDILAIREVKKIIGSFLPDTLFLNSSKAGFIGSLAARLLKFSRRPKVIYRIGGWTFNDPWPLWKKRLWIILEKISARWKDIIIVNNRSDYEQARHLGIKPRKELILVHNGIDPYRIDFFNKAEARTKLLAMLPTERAQKTKRIVGTIANLYPAKGLEDLVRAAALDEDDSAVYMIIGDGMERKKLEQLIIDSGLTEKVYILGRFENAARYLPGFDIFVLSSHKEGFPWAVLEAMSAKLPVVATKVGAIPEIIEDGVNGFIVPARNPAAIADKINLLANNELLTNTMSVAAHQAVVLKFSLEHMAGQIESLL